MDYNTEIKKLRIIREKYITDFRNTNNEGDAVFEYFPIDQKWLIPLEIKLRKSKEGPKDNQTLFQKVGTADVIFNSLTKKVDLLERVNNAIKEFNYFLFTKDMTTNKTSYPTGRFVPVRQIDGKYFADFNLAYSPTCAHTNSGLFCPTSIEEFDLAIEAGEKYQHS